MANDLTRRNNFLDNMMNMRNLMNDDFFSDFTPVEDHMKTDIEENDKQYQVKIDMPGFDKKDIHISYTNNILTITGHRDTIDDESDKNGHILHSERRYGQMSRHTVCQMLNGRTLLLIMKTVFFHLFYQRSRLKVMTIRGLKLIN